MTTNSQWLGPPQMAKTFSTATLFVEAPPVGKGLPAFLVSLLLHAAVISIVVLVFHAPRRRSTGIVPGRYTVQFLQLRPPQIRRSLAAASASAPHGLSAPLKTSAPSPSRLGAREGAGPTVTYRRFEPPAPAQFPHARQTLLQLDAPPKLVMNQIAVPDVLLWAQKITPAPRRKLVAPPLRDIPKPARALLALPTLDLPNQETNIADMRFAPPLATSVPKLPVPPATTTPIKVNGPEEGAQLPQTVSTTSSEESTAHIISISSVPLRADSLIILLPANQIALAGNGAGQGSGQDAGAGEATGTGATTTGAGAADPKQARAAVGESAGAAAGAGSAVQTLVGAGGSGDSGSAAFGSAGEGLATEAVHRITRPKDGKFSVVVIGSSAAEPYPESVGLMTGKVIYTVYLKVGTRKSWILQYCLPGPVEQKLRVKGSATPLDAPWPFLMLRPDLATSGADALMLHGLVNTDGRFEKLALVLPAGFPQKDLLLSSLRQWEFRPAKRDRQPIAVEVLLIIPGEAE